MVPTGKLENLLTACRFFDRELAGYLADDDLEEIAYMVCDSMSSECPAAQHPSLVLFLLLFVSIVLSPIEFCVLILQERCRWQFQAAAAAVAALCVLPARAQRLCSHKLCHALPVVVQGRRFSPWWML